MQGATRRRALIVLGVGTTWLLISVVLGSQTALGMSMQGNTVSLATALRTQLINNLPWIPASLAAIVLTARFPLTRGKWKRRVWIHLLAIPVVGWIANVGVVLGFWWTSGSFAGWTALAQQATLWATIRIHVAATVYGATVLLTQCWIYFGHTREREVNMARLEAQLAHARFQALNEQIRRGRRSPMADAARFCVVVVDDEPAAREAVRTLLAEASDVVIVAEAGTGRDAVARVREYAPDILFLDVQLPDMDGFSVLEALGDEVPPGIVLVTAHDHYAQRAFEVHAVDYVMKPFGRPRFMTAVARAIRRLQADEALGMRATLASLVQSVRASAESAATLTDGGDAAVPTRNRGARGKPYHASRRRGYRLGGGRLRAAQAPRGRQGPSGRGADEGPGPTAPE